MKLPIWNGFDVPVSKDILLDLIEALEEINILVLICVSDQGPKNQGLAKILGIKVGNVFFNTKDGKRRIIFAYDWVHAFKNLRCGKV